MALSVSADLDGSSLSRKQLQTYLKWWKRKATGSTDALREAYECARRELGGVTVTAPCAGVASSTSVALGNVAAAAADAAIRKGSVEKRVKRYRSAPTNSICQRIDRARTQRLYLVQRDDVMSTTDNCGTTCKFAVLGSTGNVYDVKISKLPRCSCPDHAKGNLCKHILFVMLKVIGLPSTSPLVYQAAYLQTELDDMFVQLSSRRVGGAVMANDTVRTAFASLQKEEDVVVQEPEDVKRKTLAAGDSDCPICFDAMQEKLMSSLTYCRAACGTNFHADCIQRWLGQNRKKATCPNCRQPWQDCKTGSQKKKASAWTEEYSNLGSLQGQSPKRDTSSYAEWSPYNKRRRRHW